MFSLLFCWRITMNEWGVTDCGKIKYLFFRLQTVKQTLQWVTIQGLVSARASRSYFRCDWSIEQSAYCVDDYISFIDFLLNLFGFENVSDYPVNLFILWIFMLGSAPGMSMIITLIIFVQKHLLEWVLQLNSFRHIRFLRHKEPSYRLMTLIKNLYYKQNGNINYKL